MCVCEVEGRAERRISHSPLQCDFQQIRVKKETTLKFYSVLKRTGEEDEEEEEEERWAGVQNMRGHFM